MPILRLTGDAKSGYLSWRSHTSVASTRAGLEAAGFRNAVNPSATAAMSAATPYTMLSSQYRLAPSTPPRNMPWDRCPDMSDLCLAGVSPAPEVIVPKRPAPFDHRRHDHIRLRRQLLRS
jgi:hypothetical protein